MLGECFGVESFNYLHEAKIGISIRTPKLNVHFCLDGQEVNGLVSGLQIYKV